MSTRRLPAVLALCVFTLVVWTTRIRNIWGDDELTSGQRWGRTALALSFTLLVVAVGWALYQRAQWRGLAVRVLAGWTVAVWVVRGFGISTGDHDVAFVVVHLLLAVVSITLSAVAVREESRARVVPA